MAEIAVILPVRNRATTVRRAIDSVLSQDFADFELIVVDDGSTDRTAGIVGAVSDPRLRLIRLDGRRGANVARNAGIRAARAPLLSFLDSDDEFLPEKLAFVSSFFATHQDVEVLVDSFVKLTPRRGRLAWTDRSNRVIDDQEQFRRALFTRRLWKATPAISVRKSAAVRAGLFDERLERLQDFDLLAKLSGSARCASTDRVLWIKHASADAISANSGSLIRSYIELCRRHPQFIENAAYRPGLARDIARQIRRYVAHGRLGRAAGDLKRLSRAFGWRRTGALLIEGHRPRPQL